MLVACIGYLHGAGGAERQIIKLANAMAGRGHEVHLLILATYKSEYEMHSGVIVHDLSPIEYITGNKMFLRYKALKKALKEIQPDVSIHFWLQSAYFAAFMPRRISGKVIYAERGDPGDSEYDGPLRLIRWAAFNRVSGFVFQSEEARDYFNSKVRKRSIVIHNSISLPEDKYLEPSKNREKRIVSIGRLHRQKNQKLLIDAFARITEKYPDYSLDIYGDGELKEILEKQIHDLNLSDRATIHSSRVDIFDCIYNASLFVLTSDFEGMPNALMEAMALGVPCVSTDYKPGSARMLIENGKNGCIVPMGSADLLAANMSKVIGNHEFSNELAYRAMELRKTHDPKLVFDLWESYIRKLVGLEC